MSAALAALALAAAAALAQPQGDRAAVAPPPSPPPFVRVERSPDPRRFYPRKERQAGTGGTAEIGLILRYDGKPVGCQLRSSSGSKPLDDASCRLGLGTRFTYPDPYQLAGRQAEARFGCCAWIEVEWARGTAELRPLWTERPPRIANMSRLIDAGDYPSAALRAGEQGLVVAELAVGADGRVTGCTIVQSSGSASLDGATCRLATTRAVVRPGNDRYGRAVAGTVRFRPRWILPADEPEPAAPSRPQ